MGILSWFLAAVAALLLSAFLPGRWREGVKRPPASEVAAGGMVALVTGLTATAADFGGLDEISAATILLSFFSALAAVGVVRLLRHLRTAPVK